jgi:hypothetical protein
MFEDEVRVTHPEVPRPVLWGDQRGDDQKIMVLFAGPMNDATTLLL